MPKKGEQQRVPSGSVADQPIELPEKFGPRGLTVELVVRPIDIAQQPDIARFEQNGVVAVSHKAETGAQRDRH
jgi:hypothetical protein